MTTAAQVLARFAAELIFEDIPHAVVARARDGLTDGVAVATFGARLPWSRMVVDYARRYGSGGNCSIMGAPGMRVHTPYAALANGVHAHAFEMDNVGAPGAHPGASLLPAVLAACEETGADGKTAVTAYVAGCEVMFRIALASHHSPEQLGFHAPGLIGAYGAAVAAGRVYALNADQLCNALGIAGSLSCGLLAFTKSEQGAMVKRLHLGRASESGILAARLASAGYTGPETVLDGKFGFLEVYCRNGDPNLLTAGLRERWETLQLLMKRYPCHLFAHMPVSALRELMSAHAFEGNDVARVVVEGSERLLSHHGNIAPTDISQAQYSVAFCMALALFRNPDDPKSFDANAVDDPLIQAACRETVKLQARSQAGRSVRSARLTVRLKSGLEYVRECDSFKGMPENPLNHEDLRRKFMLLTAEMGNADAAALFERLSSLEAQPAFSLAPG
jgi:2-methylcitrate dehydratase PrpD